MSTRLKVSMAVAAALATTTLVACSTSDDGATPVFTAHPETSTTTDTPSLNDQPAAASMVSGKEINVSPVDGGSKSAYQLGEVDTSTYTTDGLSWISDDEGWVKDAASSSASGRTVVFFIDGVQVPQTVMVAKISNITRINNVTVEITYISQPTGPDSRTEETVRYIAGSGELIVGEGGDPDSPALWETDIPYSSSANSTTPHASPSPPGNAAAAPTYSNDFLSSMMDFPLEDGGVSDGDLVSMITEDGNEIRCRISSDPFCVSKEPYWTMGGQQANYAKIITGEANMSDFGQGWQQPATTLSLGKRLAISEPGGPYIAWDGKNIAYTWLDQVQTAMVLTPTKTREIPLSQY